jgi:hypothetical protein
MNRGAGKLDMVRRYALPRPLAGKGTWIRQRGQFRLGERWLPFTAEQNIDALNIGFEWKARIRVAPCVSVAVTDAFINGRGLLRARVFGLPVASDSGHVVDVGELMRFLAELPWCPLAYSSRELCWEEVDEQTLKVTRVLGPTPVSVDLKIDATGQVRGAHATRPGKIGKRSFVADWVGEFGVYEEIAGMRIPTAAEVHWMLPEGKLTYFKGEVVAARIIT